MPEALAPAQALDPVIHPLARLRICALLAPVVEEEFSQLKTLTASSDSALSKQISVLVGAGYITQRRGVLLGRSRVWVALTKRGRKAFAGHVNALHALSVLDKI